MSKIQVCLLTVAVFCTVASAIPYKAEPVCSPIDEGSYYPHPDCKYYYICSVGNLIVAECAAGTFWNPATEQCDFPFNVPECVGGTRPPDGSATTPRSTTTTTRATTTIPTSRTTTATITTQGTNPTTTERSTTPLPNGCPPVGMDKIPYPGSCVLYFICYNGEPHVTNCSDGLYFNPIIKECDLPQNVDCTEPSTTTTRPTTTRPITTTRPTSTTTRSTTTTRPTTTRPVTTTRPTSTTTRSTTTTRPTTTRPVTTTRPTSTTTRPNTSTTARTTTADPGFVCPNVPFIYMPHPTDCEKFYSCENGTFQRVYSCGIESWFRFSTQSCVAPWDETCDQK